jgi:hypothetical protein
MNEGTTSLHILRARPRQGTLGAWIDGIQGLPDSTAFELNALAAQPEPRRSISLAPITVRQSRARSERTGHACAPQQLSEDQIGAHRAPIRSPGRMLYPTIYGPAHP